MLAVSKLCSVPRRTCAIPSVATGQATKEARRPRGVTHLQNTRRGGPPVRRQRRRMHSPPNRSQRRALPPTPSCRRREGGAPRAPSQQRTFGPPDKSLGPETAPNQSPFGQRHDSKRPFQSFDESDGSVLMITRWVDSTTPGMCSPFPDHPLSPSSRIGRQGNPSLTGSFRHCLPREHF